MNQTVLLYVLGFYLAIHSCRNATGGIDEAYTPKILYNARPEQRKTKSLSMFKTSIIIVHSAVIT